MKIANYFLFVLSIRNLVNKNHNVLRPEEATPSSSSSTVINNDTEAIISLNEDENNNENEVGSSSCCQIIKQVIGILSMIIFPYAFIPTV